LSIVFFSLNISHLLNYRSLIEEVRVEHHNLTHPRHFITRSQCHLKKHYVCSSRLIQQGRVTSHLVSACQIHAFMKMTVSWRVNNRILILTFILCIFFLYLQITNRCTILIYITSLVTPQLLHVSTHAHHYQGTFLCLLSYIKNMCKFMVSSGCG
jgi:hypothetical protein